MGDLLYLTMVAGVVIYICIVVLNILLSASALVYCILVVAGYRGKWRDRAHKVLYTIIWPVLLADAIMFFSTAIR